jgi:hypothetical protein
LWRGALPEKFQLVHHRLGRELGPARRHAISQWDSRLKLWLDGDDELPEPWNGWWLSYKGTGKGAPTRAAMPEPWTGSWHNPRLVTFGLNPGLADLDFQGRSGVFANKIRQAGSYSEWAASDPYGSPEWEAKNGRNVFRARRLKFARSWLGDSTVEGRDVLTVEMYPWHSKLLNAVIRPPSETLSDFIWDPLSELRVPTVFAFGAGWVSACDALGLAAVERWGNGGRDFGSSAPGRVVLEYELPSGQQLLVCWQPGYSGPPGPKDTARLLEVVGR